LDAAKKRFKKEEGSSKSTEAVVLKKGKIIVTRHKCEFFLC